MHSSIVFLTLALNIIRTRSIDSTHFEYIKVFKLTHDLLIYAILIADGQRRYIT